MATKNAKPKSRTSNSALTKKVGVPHWAIAVVVLIIAAVGGFVVFKSFAATEDGVSQVIPASSEAGYPQTKVYCRSYSCYDKPAKGRNLRWVYLRSGPNCVQSIYGQVAVKSVNDPNDIWRCLNGTVN